MKVIKQFLTEHYAEILLIVFGTALLFMLLGFRLGSLTFGNAAPLEVSSIQAAGSWRAIVDDPLNAPYTVLQRLAYYSGNQNITTMRLISTAWAAIAILLFYLVARQWHSTRVAALATWLFISSSWFLHTARLATPEIMWLVGVLALVVLFTPRKEQDSRLALPLTLIILCTLLYIPGMVWLVLVGVIVQRKNLVQAWQAASSYVVRGLSVLGAAVVLTPLAYAFARAPELVRTWAGLGTEFSPPLEMIMRALVVPKHLFISGPVDPVRWLANVPVLSIFESLMLLVGIYFYVSRLRAARSRFLVILSGVALLVYAVGGLTSLSLIIPAVYLFVATGIAFMLRQWLQVFPNNPFARSLGIVVITTAVLLTSIYQTRSYFVAWRYSPDTMNVFSQKL